jgi:hypothetical protein
MLWPDNPTTIEKKETTNQKVPSAGASLFAYFFGVEKSKASGGTRPAGSKILIPSLLPSLSNSTIQQFNDSTVSFS